MTRARQRLLASLLLLALGAILAKFGSGMIVTVGLVIAVFALLGLSPLNVWIGSPLDPRLDWRFQHLEEDDSS